MGWLRRIFGLSNRKCSCHSTRDDGCITSSDELSVSEEETKSSQPECTEEQDDEERGDQIMHTSLNFQSSSDSENSRHEHDFHPSPFYNNTCDWYSSGYEDEFRNWEQFTIFGDDIWSPEYWRHHFNPPNIDYENDLSYWDKKFPISEDDALYEPQGQHQLRCYVCGNSIPINVYGQPVYRKHPFWQQPYCRSHNRDGTPRCTSCRRLKPSGMRYVSLNDGRMICSDCLGTAIMDTKSCQPLYHEVKEFYKSLNMEVEQRIPVLLVDKFEMKKVTERKDAVHRHLVQVRGLTSWREQLIYTIIERPRIIGKDDKIVQIKTKPYKLVSHAQVKRILILYGYPRLLTASILAHEMMHAWRVLEGYPDLSLEVEEGICQVMAHMWLSSKINSMSPSHHMEKRLAEFFKYQIETNPLPNYGSGFQKGYKAVMNCGLKWTLDYIRMTSNFPP